MSSFSRKVRAIRQSVGLNQTQFAAALGVGQSTVSRWESLKFEQTPETDALLRIAQFAGVSATSLLGDEATVHRREEFGMRLRVIGAAEFGTWSESSKWEEEECFEVQVPGPSEWVDYSLAGYLIKDDSMNNIYSKHTIVFIIPTGEADEPPVADQDKVVVVRKNSAGLYETTVRVYEVHPVDQKAWLWPLSDNPRYHEPISLDGKQGGDVVSVKIVGIVAIAFVFERLALTLMS